MLKFALGAVLGLALSAGAALAQSPTIGLPSVVGTGAQPGVVAQAQAQSQFGVGSAANLTPTTSNAVPLSTATVAPGNKNISATMSDGSVLPVFGSDLFSGAFASARPGSRGDYVVQTGDQIAVRVFGAVNADAVQTVDSTGQLFIQGIGPIAVAGLHASDLQGRVTAAIQRVYTNAVGVYVSVVNGGTLGVYVSGDVQKSGRYVGQPGDSVLYFLDQAGGIDPLRGSFRNVSVRRGGRTVATYDLYDFILSGSIAPFAFQDGDTIFVSPRGALVGATGDVRNAYAFETPAGGRSVSGREVLNLAIPTSSSTSATVTQIKGGMRNSTFFSVGELASAELADGAVVTFRSDVFTETISVSVRGDIKGQSAFVMPRGATLRTVIDQLPLEGSDIVREYIHIERVSVAAAQKDALNRALDNLLRAALTEPVLGADSAQAKSAEIQAINQYVVQARQVQPDGKVAVYDNGEFHDLRLEDGDVIVLPRRTDVVLVAGEVLSPGAFAHASDLTARDYINRAGGFAVSATKNKVVLRRADGSALVVNPKVHPKAGDQIVVTPSFGQNRSIQLFRDLTQIAFQVATTAAVLINVTK